MMKKYFVEQTNKQQESEIRKFLLNKADTLCLTSTKWLEWSWFIRFKKHGGDTDPLFVKVKKDFQRDFIKKNVDNKLASTKQGKNAKYECYFYKLSQNIKNKINKETLFWLASSSISKTFYGFEDPTFYKNNEIIGYVISHEPYIFLYLTDAERKLLEKKGIKLKMISN